MVKKISLWFLCSILLAVLVFGATLLIMSSVHDISVKEQLINWFPALEQTVDTKDEKSEDIVIEDGAQEEGEETNGEQTEGETSESGETTTEGEETQSEETGETEEQTQTE